jgi:dTMP kinase
MERRGRFITLEGMDGAGKSTHVATVTDWVRSRGHAVLATREPGGTPVGEQLRTLLLHQPMQAETEALLMFAARCEHVREVIVPALERGAWVVSDRFSDASFAYQGGGRGVPAQRLALLEQWVHAGLQPDLTLLFDLPPEDARRRVAGTGVDRDRFEREQVEFFARVRAAYLERAGQFPVRMRVVDSRQPREAVRAALVAVLEAL